MVNLEADGAGLECALWRGLSKGKKTYQNDNIWLVRKYLCTMFTGMDCNVPSRKEKIDARLASPGMPESPSKRTRWVRCKDNRCLAVTDAGGVWRCYFTGEDLTDHIGEVFS